MPGRPTPRVRQPNGPPKSGLATPQLPHTCKRRPHANVEIVQDAKPSEDSLEGRLEDIKRTPGRKRIRWLTGRFLTCWLRHGVVESSLEQLKQPKLHNEEKAKPN